MDHDVELRRKLERLAELRERARDNTISVLERAELVAQAVREVANFAERSLSQAKRDQPHAG